MATNYYSFHIKWQLNWNIINILRNVLLYIDFKTHRITGCLDFLWLYDEKTLVCNYFLFFFSQAFLLPFPCILMSFAIRFYSPPTSCCVYILHRDKRMYRACWICDIWCLAICQHHCDLSLANYWTNLKFTDKLISVFSEQNTPLFTATDVD